MASLAAKDGRVSCSLPGCGNLPLRFLTLDPKVIGHPCGCCGWSFCATHATAQFHACLTLSPHDAKTAPTCFKLGTRYAEVTRLLWINITAAALKLRPSAVTCTSTFPVLDENRDVQYQDGDGESLVGRLNDHVQITFDDGAVWLARVRKTNPLVPRWQRRLSLFSEVACSTPDMVKPTHLPEWETAIDYFFLEPAVGRPYANDKEHFETIIPALAAFFVKLSNHPLNGIGSFHPDVPAVGQLVDLFTHEYHWLTLRPFRTAREHYLAKIDHVLRLIANGQKLFAHMSPSTAYLVFLEARTLVRACDEMTVEQPTYITHGDPKGGHVFLVDESESVRVSAIIDWELAYTAPMAEASCLPLFLTGGEQPWKLHPNEELLRDAYLALGRGDLAMAVEQLKGRKYNCLRQLLKGFGVYTPPRPGLLWNLRCAFLPESEAGTKPDSMEDWVHGAKERYAHSWGHRCLVEGQN